MHNIMIDIETLGRTNTAVIVQLAAVFFDPMTGEIGDEFCVNIDAEDCQENGLTIDTGTVLWWLNQDRDAQSRVFFQDKKTLYEAIISFCDFCPPSSYIIIWGNSPSFDVEILKNAFKACAVKFPFSFRNVRDFRTISRLFPEIAETHARVGTAHDALDDCRNQIAILNKCYKRIFPKNTEGGKDATS